MPATHISGANTVGAGLALQAAKNGRQMLLIIPELIRTGDIFQSVEPSHRNAIPVCIAILRFIESRLSEPSPPLVPQWLPGALYRRALPTFLSLAGGTPDPNNDDYNEV
ncbi:hypothetical protein GNZ06_06710 [Aeromonas jandaei]|uniref:hypothetical protein n=1 Tax=Aeromonas jandaei TaxID=650 RepID=UPI0019318AE0|nr:hypothetical protein [Aeromonas jandaei]MBM0490978.1 hypothetical protein [Aeromonas jandaei]MBM0568487.1 hypothetical protein [Aeromonas jandaei]